MRLLPVCCIVLFILMAFSCINRKKAIYFDNIHDTVFRGEMPDLEPVIRTNDLLSISVSSANAEASIPFNAPNIPASQASTPTGTTSQASGYLVSQDGTIQFPVLGNIQAAGLRKKQLKDELTNQLRDKKLLVDPIVNIRYLNFRVSVIGEVARPTVVTVPSEKITILEALGLAGDLTIYAKRDNVLLIREENGNKIIKRINLNTNEIFSSPYFYLKSNDVIYAEPSKQKVATTDRTVVWLPVIFSALSFITVVIDRANR